MEDYSKNYKNNFKLLKNESYKKNQLNIISKKMAKRRIVGNLKKKNYLYIIIFYKIDGFQLVV